MCSPCSPTPDPTRSPHSDTHLASIKLAHTQLHLLLVYTCMGTRCLWVPVVAMYWSVVGTTCTGVAVVLASVITK